MTCFELTSELSSLELKSLWSRVYPDDISHDFATELSAPNVTAIAARAGGKIVGFAKIVLDGGLHGFLLDPVVDPHFRRQGIGRKMVLELILKARTLGVRYVHVDYTEQLEPFYRSVGFQPTAAGLFDLRAGPIS